MNFAPINISCLKTAFNINIGTLISFELLPDNSISYFFLPLCVFIFKIGFLWVAYSWILPFYPI